jgi:hypothetical protein
LLGGCGMLPLCRARNKCCGDTSIEARPPTYPPPNPERSPSALLGMDYVEVQGAGWGRGGSSPANRRRISRPGSAGCASDVQPVRIDFLTQDAQLLIRRRRILVNLIRDVKLETRVLYDLIDAYPRLGCQ